MFEVGKLTDESLDSFLSELEKVTLSFELIFKMSKTLKKKMKRMLMKYATWGEPSRRETFSCLCVYMCVGGQRSRRRSTEIF